MLQQKILGIYAKKRSKDQKRLYKLLFDNAGYMGAL